MLKCLCFCSSSADFKSKFELERKDTDCYNSSTTSGSQQQHPPPLLPLPTPPHPFSSSSSSAGVSGAGGVPIATPAHLPDSTTDSWSGYYAAQRQDGVNKPFGNKGPSLKQRCRDYDGRNRVNHPFFFIWFLLLFLPSVSETIVKFALLWWNLCCYLPMRVNDSLVSPLTNDHCLALPSPETRGFKITHCPCSTLLSVEVLKHSHKGPRSLMRLRGKFMHCSC